VALLVEATVIARLILAVARSMLLPSADSIGFLSAGEETRDYLYIWIKRFTCWSVFGFAVAEGAWWLGVPGGIYALMLKGIALVLAVLAIVFVLQNRATISGWIAGPADLPADSRTANWRCCAAASPRHGTSSPSSTSSASSLSTRCRSPAALSTCYARPL
jgi:small conductance mechanosensitive channel